MKKNIMLRLSAVLLVAVLLTTCVISGTWAKYITTGQESDTVTVAKWGIELSITAEETLFDDSKTGDEVAALKVTDAALAAPGTYKELAEVTLTGTPDVAYSIEANVTFELGENANWQVTPADDPDTDDVDESLTPVVYCPLVFKVGATTIDGKNYSDITTLENAVKTAVIIAIAGGDGSAAKVNYNAGDEVETEAATGVLIDWTWAFGGNDAYDTQLGNATLNGGSQASVTFGLIVTVTQID